MSEELTQRIEKFIMPCIEATGAELVELKLKRQGKTAVLEVLADKADGGITLDECSWINRDIVKKLEASHVLGEDFAVEVSSPGVDRPLKTARDFMRGVGAMVRFHLREPFDGKLEHTGVVQGVKDEKVTVSLKNKQIELILSNINKAVQVL